MTNKEKLHVLDWAMGVVKRNIPKVDESNTVDGGYYTEEEVAEYKDNIDALYNIDGEFYTAAVKDSESLAAKKAQTILNNQGEPEND